MATDQRQRGTHSPALLALDDLTSGGVVVGGCGGGPDARGDLNRALRRGDSFIFAQYRCVGEGVDARQIGGQRSECGGAIGGWRC